MRSSFAASTKLSPGFSADGNRAYAHLAQSPDQLAAVWGIDGETVIASPKKGPGGTFTIDVVRFPSDFNLGATVEMRRRGQLGLPAMSDQTLYLTTVTEFSERTRVLALDGERLAFSDEELAAWLVNAERQMFAGTDNHPIFETSLEDTACAVGRLPNGQVAMTEVPRAHVDRVRDQMRVFAGKSPFPRMVVETPVRSVARYYLTAVPEGDAAFRKGNEGEITAFLLISRGGYSFGLWSPKTGLFDEYSFIAPKELEERMSAGDGTGKLEGYIRQAFDQLVLQLSPERLEQIQMDSYSRVVWACQRGMAEEIRPLAEDYRAKTGLDVFEIGVPLDEAAAGGLLFGSFSFNDDEPVGAKKLPVVNLAVDLLVQADTDQYERRQVELVHAAKRRNRAVFTILAAPVIALALLTAMFADVIREGMTLAWRDSVADSRTQELKPALDRRRSYEANLQWYQEFVTQVSGLRKQQPIRIGLLYQLDNNYPLALDPAFYVSDLKLDQKGAIEMKGLARNKDAIAAFLKSLEFAGGAESGSRLFSNLTYEVQESSPVQLTGTAMPNMAGATLSNTGVAPGVISWSMKGNYLPLATAVPADSAKAAATPAVPPSTAGVPQRN